MEDAALVRSILEGQEDLFRVIVVRYERALFRFLGRFGFTPAAREDLAQETFLRAFRALASFDAARGSLASWLFTIARNLAADERGRTRHQPAVAALDAAPEARSEGDGPAELHERAEVRERIRCALAGLPDALHSTFVLAEIGDLSLKEIAAIEGCALGTVKSRVHRAREQLRAALGATEKSR
ncbi:MAG TPA: sigma-70 family RNA polymerase sigma factor [Polyangiaceae bacterium]|nr:sigma-70 family RNA polymerase sigma factor [Polyangiaceae bacterium]